jgi:hypothetical protein
VEEQSGAYWDPYPARLRGEDGSYRAGDVAFFFDQKLTVRAVLDSSPVAKKGKTMSRNSVKLLMHAAELGELWFVAATVRGAS